MTATTDRRHVVIIGGGFAGLGRAGRPADREDVAVTLIHRNNHHQFQPPLHRVATSPLAPADVPHSLRGAFGLPKAGGAHVLARIVPAEIGWDLDALAPRSMTPARAG